jgi:outer membrane receptor protein involved in Fe transport
MRLSATPTWEVKGKAAFTDATTERSPDLPEEVGRSLARIPRWTGALSSRYRWTEGALNGWSASGSVIFVSDYVDTYADARQVRVEYPGYTYTTVVLDFRWKAGKATNSLAFKLRNAFNENLLTRIARPGAEPAVSMSFRRSY